MHGGSTVAGTAGYSHPCGHSNSSSSPREAAEALNNWGTSYFGESKSSFTVLDSKNSFSGVWWNWVCAEGEIHASKYHHDKVGGRWWTWHLPVFLKLQEQTSGGFAMGWFCPTEKSLPSFTANGHSSPALLCISGLSVCRLFSLLLHPFSLPAYPCLFALWLQKNTVYFQADYFCSQAALTSQDSRLVLLKA